MSPIATIQLTTMELVMGKPNGLAISTAFCDGPCSSCSGVVADGEAEATALAATCEPLLDCVFTANAQSAPRHMETAVMTSAISLVFKLGKTSHPVRSE